MWFSHGDGMLPGFRLKRLPDEKGRRRFELASNHSHHSRYSDEHSDRSEMSDSQRRAHVHENLEDSFDFHRPPARIERQWLGWVVIEHPAAAAYDRCAVRTARASARNVEAQARDPNEKKQWRRWGTRNPLGHDQWNRFEFKGARTLLALMSLPVPGFGDGPYFKSARERAPGHVKGQEEDAFAWKDRMILAHGREFQWKIDVAGLDSRSQLCRSLEPEKLRAPDSDTCSLGGVIDKRDGWPIVIGISRQWKDTPGVTSSAGMTFYRLPPKSDFVVPPNPCASVYRGNPAPVRTGAGH